MAQCSPEGASTTTARVAQMSVTVTSSGGSSPRAWVEDNLELVALAIVHLLGVPAGQRAGGAGRVAVPSLARFLGC